jgi:hypothetical protein
MTIHATTHATAAPAPEKTGEQRYFAVTVRYRHREDNGGPHDIPGGGWRGLAADSSEAEAKAHSACWDSRLDITDCYPVYEIQEMQRYCSNDRWLHTFVGNSEETVRWIFDRGTQTLVRAQVLDGQRWINLDAWPRENLQLRLAEIADDAEFHELQVWDHVPDWQEVEALAID